MIVYIMICGLYGWVNEDGMNYCSIVEEVLERNEKSWGGITDITTLANDPGNGERVWEVKGINQSALTLLEAEPLIEIQ